MPLLDACSSGPVLPASKPILTAPCRSRSLFGSTLTHVPDQSGLRQAAIMLWDDGYDSGWYGTQHCVMTQMTICRHSAGTRRDEALHAHCAAAERGLPAAHLSNSDQAPLHRLSAKPVLGRIHLQPSGRRLSQGQAFINPTAYSLESFPPQQQHEPQQHHEPKQQQQQAMHSDRMCSMPILAAKPDTESATTCQQHAKQHLLPDHQSGTSAVSHHQSTYPQHSRLHANNQQQHVQQNIPCAGRSVPVQPGTSSLMQQQQQQQQDPLPPRLTQEHIKHAAHEFSKRMHTLPPLAPRHSRYTDAARN